jgi:hypothetical protein
MRCGALGEPVREVGTEVLVGPEVAGLRTILKSDWSPAAVSAEDEVCRSSEI